jgi:urate oxidase
LKSTGLVKLPGLWETVRMPKEEQPQTHENGEAQKLVDRIETKVSAQRKNRSSKTPSKPPQQKRDLRVVKWMGTIPAIGVCTYCSRQFKVPPESMQRVADAQWNLDLQFKEHKCKREDARQATARIVRG